MSLISFETELPKSLSFTPDGRIAVTDKHYKYGRRSLKWNFGPASRLSFFQPIGYRPSDPKAASKKIDTFSLWVYNERPIDGSLTVQFERGGETDCWFAFHLNFTGWRTAWVAYERDMQGKPHPRMDTVTLVAPDHVQAGTIYIDQIITSSPVDPRFHSRDAQVPSIHPEADKSANSHWLSLYRFFLNEQLAPPFDPALPNQIDDLKRIETRFEQLIDNKPAWNETWMDEIRNQYASFHIRRDEGFITGDPVHYLHYEDIYLDEWRKSYVLRTNRIHVKTYAELMLRVATAYRSAIDDSLRQQLCTMFIDLTDHLHDQGWASGSGLGTLHHLGYSMRSYYSAMYLMKKVLREHGRLERCAQDMAWLSGLGRIYEDDGEYSGGIIDIFNTTLHGMLAAVLIRDDADEKAGLLAQMVGWLEKYLRPAPGLMACFKVDGSAFHHKNHYPGYVTGGFMGVTPIVYVLSGTAFRIRPDAHASLKKALMAMRLYCNKREWLVSLSSRHPNGKGSLALQPYKYMALSGTPDGAAPIDKEAASAYLRLLGTEMDDGTAIRLRELVQPEEDPNGNWTMNYACLSIHRREHWLAGVRGHSRYLWANEAYSDANLYGRYITYGQIQLLGDGDPVTNRDSGFVHDGWDWNRWPGTTAIRQPFGKLRSDVRNVDAYSGFEEMLLSDETYAGGINLEGLNGMFAMKLHEHPKYDGSHRARKSVFMFDNRIIALGSGIENTDSAYPTETTLFQSALRSDLDPIWWNSSVPIRQLPYTENRSLLEPCWLMDNHRNGYYIPAGQRLSVHKKTQHSKAQHNGEDTSGDFAAAWIDHGKAPKEGEYEYAIVVNTDVSGIESFAERMRTPATAPYSVLQKDRAAHVVQDKASGITGYALFETNGLLAKGVIQSADTPCMVMTRVTNGVLTISAVDPDLRLYPGVESDQYDESGVQREVSLYSRTWTGADSGLHRLRLTLAGRWKLRSEADNCRVVRYTEKNTVLEMECKHALPVEVRLDGPAP